MSKKVTQIYCRLIFESPRVRFWDPFCSMYSSMLCWLQIKCILLADDAAFYSTYTELTSAVVYVQQFLPRLANWLINNKLTADETKTNLMIFSPCAKPHVMPVFHFNDRVLELDNVIRWLCRCAQMI